MKLIKFIALFLLCLSQTYQKCGKGEQSLFADKTGRRGRECLGHEDKVVGKLKYLTCNYNETREGGSKDFDCCCTLEFKKSKKLRN